MANSTEHVTNIQAASAHYNVSARPMEDWNFNVVVMEGSWLGSEEDIEHDAG